MLLLCSRLESSVQSKYFGMYVPVVCQSAMSSEPDGGLREKDALPQWTSGNPTLLQFTTTRPYSTTTAINDKLSYCDRFAM